MTTVASAVTLLCPRCRSPLDAAPGADGDELRCTACARRYPVIGGVPDLRSVGDRYLTLEEDRAKARRLAAIEGSLIDLVRAYWEMTPEVPRSLAEKYVQSTAADVPRGDAHLDRISMTGTGPLLDIGCGTGGLVTAAGQRGINAVGVDIALRWLVIAARGLADAGINASLVAADGADLPFAPGTFAVTTCVETLEHAADQRALLRACIESVAPGGTTYVVTANRFSLAPEPVVGLVGVGYLPRRWAPAYVRWRRSTRYQFFRTLSARELRRLAGPTRTPSIRPAQLPPAPPGASTARRLGQRGYEAASRVPLLSPALGLIGPYNEMIVMNPPSDPLAGARDASVLEEGHAR